MPATPARSVIVALLAALAACGGGPETPGPEGLAYARPDPNPATYTFADTAELSIETAVGPMDARTALAGIAELEFRGRDHELQVLVRFPELRGEFRSATQDPALADASDVGGPFTVRVAPTGFVAITDTATLDGILPDIAGPESLVRGLFVHLPGRPVGSEARWVDTVRVAEASNGTRLVTRNVITSRLDGDTVVVGRRLLRIRTETASDVELTGVSGGVDVVQTLAGTLTGTVLWDHRRRILFGRTETGSLSGTISLPGVDAPAMPVRLRIHSSITLRE